MSAKGYSTLIMTGLVEYQYVFKIIEKCSRSDTTNVQPAPSTHGSSDHKHLGLAFDKLNSCNYLANCDAIFETFNFPNGMTVLTQEDTMLSKLQQFMSNNLVMNKQKQKDYG